MHRSHTCGVLRQTDLNKDVILAGWVQRVRDKGFVLWIDLRDRYGVTQLVLDEERCDAALISQAKTLGREFVIQVHGRVIQREAKNTAIPTGEVEI
ncbi:MAG: OB-fold nucleic acid binding domain-containing protein, partial [Flavobacteriales bacterium]|nr:OB-fold nucleic acid binding domain-containing protein [Flavobacteriales bacterium]